MNYYVYDLIDPRNGNPFYVGKGKGNRVAQHENDAKRGEISEKCDRIRDIWAAGHKVERRIVQHFVWEKEAYAFEEKRISEIGLSNLTNKTSGGGRNVSNHPNALWNNLDDLGKQDVRIINMMSSVDDLIKKTMKENDKTSGVYQLCKGVIVGFLEVVERRGNEWINKHKKLTKVTVGPSKNNHYSIV